MGKETALKSLSDAKKEYTRWVMRAETMMEGLPIGPEQIPVKSTECDFGIWLSGEGQKVAKMPGMDSFKTIVESHEQVHDLYEKIFFVFGSIEKHPVLHKVPKLEKNPLFRKLLTRKRRSSTVEKEMAAEYYTELKQAAKRFIDAIERLERRLGALPSSSFK